MDVDPTLYFTPSSPDLSSQTTPPAATVSTRLPTINLPTLPRPSVSPSSTRVSFTQQQKSGRTSAGLDLSKQMQQNEMNEMGGMTRGRGGGNSTMGHDKGSLEDEVARARSERAARRNLTSFNDTSSDSTPTSPTLSNPSSSDPRDTASARENIMNLVSSGQSQSSTGNAPSLAMFMGGGKGRRVHKVNSEMTEQEREVTKKLEKEMEATRAKWGNNENDPPTSRGGGMSLASLMNRQVGGGIKRGDKEDEPKEDEPKRWQPSVVSPPQASFEPTRAQTAPAASSKSNDSLAPKSLAAAFGSTASGPRLNSAPKTSDVTDEGPAHARSGGGYAMPGLAKEATASSKDEVRDAPESVEQKEEPSPTLVEPKVFSRPAPPPSTSEPTPAPSSPSKVAFPSMSPNDSPSKPAQQNSTLGRLRGSSIVAERLKLAEQRQQSSPLSSPTKERSSNSMTSSPEKRKSVVERWGRDQPNVFGSGGASNPVSPTKSYSLSSNLPPKSPGFGTGAGAGSPWSGSGKPLATSPKEEGTEGKQLVNDSEDTTDLRPTLTTKSSGTYSKPSWEHAPIGVKTVSKQASPAQHPDEETPIERKHTRGVALPGLGGPTSSPSLPASSTNSYAPPSPTKQKTDPTPSLPTSSSGGVRAAAMKWGRTDSDAQREKLEELKRLKESYGVKVVDQETPRSIERTGPTTANPTMQQEKPKVNESKPTPAAQTSPAPVSSQPRKPVVSSSPAPSSTNPLVDRIVSIALSPSPSPRLSGEILSLDVFHLNSPTDNPHPIEHNHILHSPEILGIVVRTAPPNGSIDEVETKVWVWRGREAEETGKTRERISKLEKKTGEKVSEVKWREEPRDLVEAFEGQLTVCKGLREHFDHLAKRLFVVSSRDEVVFVEETEFTARSLCSGYSAVLSLPGEVYAWLGEGSVSIEREACCQFAESIADGRSVNVLAEGEETQWFWQSLDEEDNVEYPSANYWRRRYENTPSASFVRISSSSASQVSTIDASSIHLLDGASLENYVLVPEAARGYKAELKAAFEAAKLISSKWEERGFESKTPVHVLVFPSLVPRDLPYLARSIDFDLLNNGTRPRKMNVFTLGEAEKELL
ncbi:hypothetical protein JCM16303_003099 [Sporobolomyces ruberrimus]